MKCVGECNRFTLNGFYAYGHLVGRKPLAFLVTSLIICIGLSVGILTLNPLTDMEDLYTPMGSRAESEAIIMANQFPDKTGNQYDVTSLNNKSPSAKIIFRGKDNSNLLRGQVLDEIKTFLDEVKSINVTLQGMLYTHADVCAKRHKMCVVSGDFILDDKFRSRLQEGNLTYPVSTYYPTQDLSLYISQPVLNGDGTLLSASSIRITLPLRMDSDKLRDLSWDWETKFLDYMELHYNDIDSMDIAYMTSESLNTELDKSTNGDIVFFCLTFTFMIVYAFIVSSGGDMVSTRAFLSSGGVVATVLGIVASFGLVSLCGVRYVNMVGVMPFLLLGIGVDDMFLLMSSWSETGDNPELTVSQRCGIVFKRAGMGITITSVTNCLSFAIGATSVFRSVRNFCIYTGVGVIVCYLSNVTFFGACLALHGRRVHTNRHTLTCRPVRSSDDADVEDRHCCYRLLCTGKAPTSTSHDQSICEKFPRKVLPQLFLWKPSRYIIIVIFSIYLAMAIWGCTRLEEGLDLNNLVTPDSYLYKFQAWEGKDYGSAFPVSFVTTSHKDYLNPQTLDDMKHLIQKALSDREVNSQIFKCWLTSYANSPFYNSTSHQSFIDGLAHFLRYYTDFQNDVSLDGMTVVASRCHIFTLPIWGSASQASLMVRMRQVADSSPATDFAFNGFFIYFEQFILILPTTLKTVAITLAVMLVVTIIFLPHPIIVGLVMLQVVMIVTGIFGFMSHLGLTLSSITMIHLIMSVGLSVDFCAHVCTAYVISEKSTREEKALDAVVHASGPILNGGTSSFIGILGLVFSQSYIFQSFFKIMMLVLLFGMAHAVFFVPALLCIFGPKIHSGGHQISDQNSATYSSGNNDRNGGGDKEIVQNGDMSPTRDSKLIQNDTKLEMQKVGKNSIAQDETKMEMQKDNNGNNSTGGAKAEIQDIGTNSQNDTYYRDKHDLLSSTTVESNSKHNESYRL